MADLSDVIARLEKQDARLERIETIVQAIATQNVRIDSLQRQTDGLWKKYDEAFGPEGIVLRINRHQASCPRAQFARMWWAIGFLATITVGLLIKTGAMP